MLQCAHGIAVGISEMVQGELGISVYTTINIFVQAYEQQLHQMQKGFHVLECVSEIGLVF